MRRYSKGVWRGWANHFSSHTRKESALIIEFVSGSHVAELIQQLIDIPLPQTNGYTTQPSSAIFGLLLYTRISRGHSPSHGQTPSRPHICYRLYIGCITNTTRGGRREGAPSWSRSRRVAQVFSCRAATAADGRRAQPAGCRYLCHSLPNRPTDPNINNLLGSHQAQNNISPQSREVCDASDFESRLS